MNDESIYPRIIVGAFIFNENDKLLLVRAPRWQNKYTCVGGKIEIGETMSEALVREIKEETNLEVKDITLLGILDDINLDGTNDFGYKHLIFIDHTAIAINPDAIKLNEEGETYEWLTIVEWLKKEQGIFAPSLYKQLVKINEIRNSENFEHKYKRALADYQNLLKQTAREKQDFYKFAIEQFLHEILPVYDNLKIAVMHSGQNNHDALIEGIKYVIKQFNDILSANGVEEIKTVGEKFDHNIMEAVDNETTSDEDQDDSVAKEIRAGYKLNGKVIVPAKVAVHKFEK